MGNSSSHENEDDFEIKKNKDPKNKNQEKVQILPYVDGMPVIESRLQKIIKKDEENKEKDNELQQMKKQQELKSDLNEEIKKLERQYFQSIQGHVQQEYESYSKENKMGQKDLLEYFGLQDLEKQKLGTRFFLTAKSTLSVEKTGPYLDYSKFLKTLTMLAGNNYQGRLQFLYQLFDINLDGKIEREEMRDILQMILDALLSVNYEDQDLQMLKSKISDQHEKLISLVLDQITSEIYANSNESGVINFDQWKKWITEIQGFDEVLNFNPHEDILKNNNYAINNNNNN